MTNLFVLSFIIFMKLASAIPQVNITESYYERNLEHIDSV